MRARLLEAGSENHDELTQLLEFNAYEFSRFDGRRLRADGTYDYRYLDAYWEDDDRYAYLIVVGAETAGLALARQNSATDIRSP